MLGSRGSSVTEFYLHIPSQYLYEVVEYEDEWYSDSACRTSVILENFIDPADMEQVYVDQMHSDEWRPLCEMEVIALCATPRPDTSQDPNSSLTSPTNPPSWFELWVEHRESQNPTGGSP